MEIFRNVIITKNEFEWGKTLVNELKTHVEISIDHYISKFHPDYYESVEVFDINVTMLDASGGVFKFSISFSEIPELTLISILQFLKEELSSYWKYIFEGENGYYIIFYNSIRLSDFTTVVSAEGIKTNLIMLNVNYKKFNDVETVTKFIQYYEIGSSRSPRLPKAECDIKYTQYKKACQNLWEINKDRSVENSQALNIIESLGDCIKLRKEHLTICHTYNVEGHAGAIQKMESLQKFYANLLISRLERYIS